MAMLLNVFRPNLTRSSSHVFRKLFSVNVSGSNRNEEEIAKENWKQRCDLATAYRALMKYGMAEGVCNHLTVKAPSLHHKEPIVLIIPYGLYWADVTPESLVGIDVNTAKLIEGKDLPETTAHSIHRGIYRYRPDVNSIMHSHPIYATILSNLKNPELQMIHQNCTRFYDCVVYDTNYEGLANDGENKESDRLGQLMADKSKTVLLMGNHGISTVGESVAVAFDRLYYFEKAAQNVVLAYQTGQPLSYFSLDVVVETQKAMESNYKTYSDNHLYGIQRHLMKEDPSFIKNKKEI